jgi:integrase
MRARHKTGSLIFDKARGTWRFLQWVEGKRESKTIGTKKEYPTKATAWKAVKPLTQVSTVPTVGRAPTVSMIVEQYRAEKMPRRASTRRGYNTWLENHILPRWGTSPLTDVQARPVELWLRSLTLAPKSKLHIRGLLSVLWDYAMWRDDLPTQRNPMELVSVPDASHRVHKPRSLTVEEFQTLLGTLGNDDPCWRTILLLIVSFGLRISELLGLKWSDVDWMNKTVRIERGVVKQIVASVKTDCSARTMICADELLEVLKQWRQTTQFSAPDDWMFASPVQLGRMPYGYTHVWRTLSKAAERGGIGHVSSHVFRHTHRSWLDSVGTPVGVQQKLMRHADIRTTMNIYGDAMTVDMRQAHEKIVRLALPQANGSQTDHKIV